MILNKKRENILITAFRLILSVILGFVMGIGVSISLVSVALYQIIKNYIKATFNKHNA